MMIVVWTKPNQKKHHRFWIFRPCDYSQSNPVEEFPSEFFAILLTPNNYSNINCMIICFNVFPFNENRTPRLFIATKIVEKKIIQNKFRLGFSLFLLQNKKWQNHRNYNWFNYLVVMFAHKYVSIRWPIPSALDGRGSTPWSPAEQELPPIRISQNL